jgi:hypothetical protein
VLADLAEAEHRGHAPGDLVIAAAAAAGERPWWQHELRVPAEDARIPVRQHEPRRKDTLNSGRITLG